MGLNNFLSDLKPEVLDMLEGGKDRKTVQSEIAGRIRDSFPETESPEGLASILLAQVANAIRDGRGITLRIDAKDSPQTAPAERKHVQRKLNFRLIKDDRLDLNDRIVFSYLWKWAWINHRRKLKGITERRVTVSRLRKATGFRPSTLKQTLVKLRRHGYIDDQRKPFVKDDRLMKNATGKVFYRRLAWNKAEGTRQGVFRAFVLSSRKSYSAGWYQKSLGIPRRTYFRLLKKGVTDGTGVVTDGTPKK